MGELCDMCLEDAEAGRQPTRRGKPVAAVVGHDEWQRLNGARPTFAEFLLASPELGDPRRDRSPPRDLGL